MRLGLPGEVGLFARIAAYGIFIAIVYWLVAYEFAGAILLAGFGVATAVVAAFLASGRRRVGRAEGAQAAELAPQNEGPFGDEVTRVPGPSVAPFALGLGLSIAFLGLVFGGWLVVAGGVLVLLGAREWIAEVIREHRAMR